MTVIESESRGSRQNRYRFPKFGGRRYTPTHFHSDWSAQAPGFGWTERELFGLHPAPELPAANYDRLARLDSMGLIRLLQGRAVIALTATTAAIQHSSGHVITYRKLNKPAFGPLGDRLHGASDMSGRRSRDKGNRTERAIVRVLQAHGLAATKISGMYKPGADINMLLLGVDRAVEVKCRAEGFRELYSWLNKRDVLIVKANRQEPLVVLRLGLAAEIAKRAA
jgi:hypothetical protein